MALGYNRIFDREGGYDGLPREERRGTDPVVAPEAAPAPVEPPPQTGGSAPGPSGNPQPPQSGNPAPPSPPVPPAVPSAVQGVQASEATGGVRGTFGQAGSSDFSKRFGTPASWFKGAGTAPSRGASGGILAELANRGRGVLGRGQAGASGGGAVTVPVVAGPSVGLDGGGENDEQFQRIMAEVLRQRFGRG